jgi:pimeloyl-ACP methyl ester carboxylesterase
MKSMRPRLLCAACLLFLAACRTHEAPPASIARDPAQTLAPPGPPSGSAAAAAAAASAPPAAPAASTTAASDEPATVARFDVARDVPASIVHGRDGKPPRIVFLPGVCSNAYAYLLSFPEAARAHGGVVAIDGDRPCGAEGSGFRSFSWDPARQDARLQAAFVAAGVAGEGGEPPDGLTLVGYSAGAGIGELMVQRWPKRYARVVLIGAPSDPSPARLASAKGVVTMSCSRDVPGRMRDAARRITAAGVPSTYLEMPGCTHGNIADGERVFETAFDWLADNAKE